MQEAGRRITFDDQEAVVRVGAGFLDRNQAGNAGVDAGGQFLGLDPVLVERLPLQLIIAPIDQKPGRHQQREIRRYQGQHGRREPCLGPRGQENSHLGRKPTIMSSLWLRPR